MPHFLPINIGKRGGQRRGITGGSCLSLMAHSDRHVCANELLFVGQARRIADTDYRYNFATLRNEFSA
jgi:hypothetical protein